MIPDSQSGNNRSRVTALVPAYQAADFIQRTLDSLSSQTHGNFDVIISVDVCDDETHAICERHDEDDPRFRVILQSERLGYVGNCNFLLGQADADYVLFAFHDDVLAPDYVEKLGGVLDSRPEVVNCYSDVLLTPVEGEQELWVYKELEGISNRVQRGASVLNCFGKWWVPNRGVFRLREARRIQGLKKHGAGEFSADWPWLFHMALLGEFARVPETLCFKYYQPGSLSRNWAFTGRQQYEVTVACMREIWISDLTTEEKLQIAIPLMKWLAQTFPKIKNEPIPEDKRRNEK